MITKTIVTDSKRQLKIPVLSPDIEYLIKNLSNEELSIADLSKIVEPISIVVARLISLANSAWIGVSRPVTSINEACYRLGINIVKSTSIVLAVSSPFNMRKCPDFEPELFWLNSLLVAEVAHHLANAIKTTTEIDPQTLRTAGLLHNIGLLWLADALPNETGLAINSAQIEPTLSVNNALINECGIGYDRAGGMLAEIISLPKTLQILISEQENASYQSELCCSVQLLILAKSIVKALLKNDAELIQFEESEQLKLVRSDIEDIYSKVKFKQSSIHELSKLMLSS